MTLPSSWNPLVSTSANLCFPEPFFDRATVLCRTKRDELDNPKNPKDSPFKRYVDLWMLSLIVGRASSQFLPSSTQKKFIDGSIFQGDMSRISIVLSIVYLHEGKDSAAIESANSILAIANGYVAGGLPLVLESIENGPSSSIENLFKALIDNEIVSDGFS